MKKCGKCKLEKELNEFGKHKINKDGLRNTCKKCRIIESKNYIEKNREEINLRKKERRKNNIEKVKESQKNWYHNNIEKAKDVRKKYYQKNKEKIKKKAKEYRESNKDYYMVYQKKYSKNYNEKNKEKKRFYEREKRKNDFLFKTKKIIKSLIMNSFRKKEHKRNDRVEFILGCTYQEFKLYLESKFESWMNWDNYGNPKDGIFELNKSWDIDHIIPLASALNEDELIRLNHYTNLQPLCSYTNRFIKRDKLLD